ncbi:RxLR effector protein [Phytophthora megakarya]|uniref:RxLR effector protein n=1 Tax=Phytophthora megakarya TaxID=4795 RepID=A0A225VKT7_9STRA|nr:RxLR effector protein [Phytophthora megakarya]
MRLLLWFLLASLLTLLESVESASSSISHTDTNNEKDFNDGRVTARALDLADSNMNTKHLRSDDVKETLEIGAIEEERAFSAMARAKMFLNKMVDSLFKLGYKNGITPANLKNEIGSKRGTRKIINSYTDWFEHVLKPGNVPKNV